MLSGVAAFAFLLVVHNYGTNLLPYASRIIAPDQMQPDPAQPSFAYHVRFGEGVPDRVREMRSRTILAENGQAHSIRTISLAEIRTVGGDRYGHFGDQVIFATSDNSDPRNNGRVYTLAWPILYNPTIGRGSALLLVLALLALWRWRRPAVRPANASLWPRWAWAVALVVFLAGLYANTGTRAPYAISFLAHIDPVSGHAYNQDHVHFKTVFDFVDGQPREVWDRALLLRRILYPAMAWPAMKWLGFEAGGAAMNLLIHVAAFVGCTWWLQRRIGSRAAQLGAWLLATYPGFAYWAGLPYQYALIAPGSLLLAIALSELAAGGSRRRVATWALVMGVTYLAYDFAPVFLPATLGVLLWRRRWLDAMLALVAGVLPLVCWLLTLRYGFGQALENSNSGVYRTVFETFVSSNTWSTWLAGLPRSWDTAAAAYFGANFVFLPALFLGVCLVNPWTSRVSLTLAERAILGGVGALFAVINLAPEYGGTWNMAGSWIARLYQPMFPVLVFFLARWWQALPDLARWGRGATLVMVVAACAANLLVIFGPVTGNPLGVSGEVFYRFYTHSDGARLPAYENNLRQLPTRPLGFGRTR